jgi:hypothetical protein
MPTQRGVDASNLRNAFALTIALLVAVAWRDTRLSAQARGFTPLTVDGITISGSLRTRLESWDWFGGSSNGTYTYPGTLARIALRQSRRRHDWSVEFSVPLLFALPEQPPGAGLGANYFVANDRIAIR